MYYLYNSCMNELYVLVVCTSYMDLLHHLYSFMHMLYVLGVCTSFMY